MGFILRMEVIVLSSIGVGWSSCLLVAVRSDNAFAWKRTILSCGFTWAGPHS